MCGIAGSINFALNIPVLTKSMYHRGPDEQTTYSIDNLQLHHHRLAIVDIAGGKQPMHFNNLTIIFNGEIYNHLEVRKALGLDCLTSSDTETILHAYAKLGPACLDHFDGMFAFCIHDTEKNEIFLARDRAGKKPLYYYKTDKELIFASELNAIKSQIELSVNEEHLQQYIRMGYFYKEATPYKNVWELPAGSFARISLGTLKIKITKWWDIGTFYEQQRKISFETALNDVDQMIHHSVKRRVESSDLEVGAFLSGGIDSGIVSAIATQYNSKLKTFTVSFDGEFDESPLAKLVADQYGTNHHEIRISFDSLLNDVETILSNYGEPFFDSSAIPSYYVSREARKHLTVILNGDGGDELFGGYRRYMPFAKYDFFNSGFFIRNPAKFVHSFLPVANNKKSKYNYIYRLVDFARKSGLDTYLSATIDSFEGYEQKINASLGYLKKVEVDFAKINMKGGSGLQKIMHLDFDNILAGDLLVKMDIATMAHSLEGRSPLLSKELLEYVPSLPDKYKINSRQTKYLLRTLAQRYLPAELINQPKRGFEIPLKKWIDTTLKDMIGDYILNPNAYCRQYVQGQFIDDLWNHKVDCGEEKRAKMLWTLFALEVWYRKCYLSQ